MESGARVGKKSRQGSVLVSRFYNWLGDVDISYITDCISLSSPISRTSFGQRKWVVLYIPR